MGHRRKPHRASADLRLAIAVTSIPVISRIMLYLGLLGTRFSRIVLSVAVIEDVVLYVVLAVAVASSRPAAQPRSAWPARSTCGPARPATWPTTRSPPSASSSSALAWAAPLQRGAALAAERVVKRQSQIGFQLIVLLAAAGACLSAEHRPAVRRLRGRHRRRHGAGRARPRRPARRSAAFAMGLFIPAYFATVGLSLDLVTISSRCPSWRCSCSPAPPRPPASTPRHSCRRDPQLGSRTSLSR